MSADQVSMTGDNTNKHNADHRARFAEFQSKYRLEASPDVIELIPGQRLVVSGDLHGNYGLLVGRLRAARVIVEKCKGFSPFPNGLPSPDCIEWEPNNNTIFVQAGDVLDRGYHELECLELLARLSRQAAKKDAGGAVIVLWGNHEIMNAIGDFRVVNDHWCSNELLRNLFLHADDIFASSYQFCDPHNPSSPIRWFACEPGGLLSSCFLAQCKVAVQVGQSVCVHAHWNEACSSAYPSIETLNHSMREFILLPISKQLPAEIRAQLYRDRYGEVVTTDAVVWGRPKHPERIVTKELLKHFPANRLIVGHDIHPEVESLNNGVLWHVDTNNVVEVLQVTHDDQVTIWKPDGTHVEGRHRERNPSILMPSPIRETRALYTAGYDTSVQKSQELQQVWRMKNLKTKGPSKFSRMMMILSLRYRNDENEG